MYIIDKKKRLGILNYAKNLCIVVTSHQIFSDKNHVCARACFKFKAEKKIEAVVLNRFSYSLVWPSHIGLV